MSAIVQTDNSSTNTMDSVSTIDSGLGSEKTSLSDQSDLPSPAKPPKVVFCVSTIRITLCLHYANQRIGDTQVTYESTRMLSQCTAVNGGMVTMVKVESLRWETIVG